MVKKKGKSKRVTLRQKYKVIKKVKEHKRKMRKESIRKPRKTKNPGIPNEWPYKEELLNELEQARLAEIEHSNKLREMKRLGKLKEKARVQKVIKQVQHVPETTVPQCDGLDNALEKADLVCIVLDSRDPQGCRSLSLEEGLIENSKKIAFVLNKTDLIPEEVTKKWLTYLGRLQPTVAVRSLNATRKDIVRRGRKSVKERAADSFYSKKQQIAGMRDVGQTLALQSLLNQLPQVLEHPQDESPLCVAFVGYPNVGKSSVINALKKRELCAVAPRAGTTSRTQRCDYNGVLSLIDCPPLSVDFSAESSSLMRHCVAGEYSLEPAPVVDSMLHRSNMADVCEVFRVAKFSSTEDFLRKLAEKCHVFRAGGEPDLVAIARIVIDGMKTSTYPFSCLPPSKIGTKTMPSWGASLDMKPLLIDAAVGRMHAKEILMLKGLRIPHEEVDSTEYDVAMGIGDAA